MRCERRCAKRASARLRTTLDEIRAEGVTSANGIAMRLNQREIATPRGGRWSARTVSDVLARLAADLVGVSRAKRDVGEGVTPVRQIAVGLGDL